MVKHKTNRGTLIRSLGMERVLEAERRLCGTCHFQQHGLCGPNPALLPLTSKGEDCPYYLAKGFGSVVASKG